jgi:hypothetical protein
MKVNAILCLFAATLVAAAPADLDARKKGDLDVKIGHDPDFKVTCPATNNGDNRNYEAHDFTEKQQTAALKTAAKLRAANKQIGARTFPSSILPTHSWLTRSGLYPHDFNNNENLPFPCGAQKMEFPIQLDGKVYDGGDADGIPDRIVFEYKVDGDDLKIDYCGIMRHGPGRDFLNCAKA